MISLSEVHHDWMSLIDTNDGAGPIIPTLTANDTFFAWGKLENPPKPNAILSKTQKFAK